jgi:RNA polymerase sigma-70 factor (ECF subfamily)
MGVNDADHAELERLLAGCAEGDLAALSALYGRASARLHAVVLRIVGRRDLAETVLGDAFVRIWEEARAAGASGDSRGRPLAWMVSIARYEALAAARRMGRSRPHATELAPGAEAGRRARAAPRGGGHP